MKLSSWRNPCFRWYYLVLEAPWALLWKPHNILVRWCGIAVVVYSWSKQWGGGGLIPEMPEQEMCGNLGLTGQRMNATQWPFLSIKGLFSDSSNWKISPRTFKPWSPLFYDPFADLFAPQSSLYNLKLCTQRALNWGGIYMPLLLIWLFCYALTHSIPECGFDFPVAQSGLCLWPGSQTQDLWGSY